MRVPGRLLPHQVIIRALAATTPEGVKQFGDPRTVRALVDDAHTTIRTSDNREVVASATVYVDGVNYAAPGCQVTIWPGTPREASGLVLTAAYYSDRAMPAVATLTIG